MALRMIFFGDIVGKLGRRAVIQALPDIREKYTPDIVIANAENASHGAGFSKSAIQELRKAGIDIFTGGNHSWVNSEGVELMNDPEWRSYIIRPENMRRGEAGAGHCLWTSDKGIEVLIFNLIGSRCMPENGEPPFQILDSLIEMSLSEKTANKRIIFVDFHAELTAEKEALAMYVDGRVGAVIGTHTHVQTSDARILPGGTAYCTDAGRCGGLNSVLGFEKESAIERFLGHSSSYYEIEPFGSAEVDGVCVSINEETGLATDIDGFRFLVDVFPENE